MRTPSCGPCLLNFWTCFLHPSLTPVRHFYGSPRLTADPGLGNGWFSDFLVGGALWFPGVLFVKREHQFRTTRLPCGLLLSIRLLNYEASATGLILQPYQFRWFSRSNVNGPDYSIALPECWRS